MSHRQTNGKGCTSLEGVRWTQFVADGDSKNYRLDKSPHKVCLKARVHKPRWQANRKGLDRQLANMKNEINVYRINNTIHHFMSSLLPVEGHNSKFSQFYIFDNTEDAVRERRKIFPKLSSALMLKIEDCLRKNNELI